MVLVRLPDDRAPPDEVARLRAENRALRDELARLAAARGAEADRSARETLAREADHRVKNSLQMVASMLRLQAARHGHPILRDQLRQAAEEGSTHAFATFLAGAQGRWGRLTVFGQYQLHTAAGDASLLHGVMHTVHGGIRIALGSSKEGVRGGY